MSRDFDPFAFGAPTDGCTPDESALQAAIDAAHAAGGGRVVLAPGKVLVAASFELRSGVELHLAEGAVLRAPPAEERFFRHRVFDRGEEKEKRVWLRGHGAEEVALTGSGTLDGRGLEHFAAEGDFIYASRSLWRPALTCFVGCRRVRIEKLTIRDSPNWTLHFTGCEEVEVCGVTIRNSLKAPNCDGIVPDRCRNVRIQGCDIESGDDGIVLKTTESFAAFGASGNIVVEDCRVVSTSAAVKLGSESHGDISRVRFSRIRIERSHRGIGIQLRDGGCFSDIVFEDFTIETRRFAPVWWGAGEPVCVTVLPRVADRDPGLLRGVRFSRLRAEGENGIFFFSHPPGRIEDVELEDVELRVRRTSRWPMGICDVRPAPPGILPAGALPVGESTPWGVPCALHPAPLHFEGLTDARLRHCRAEIEPALRPFFTTTSDTTPPSHPTPC